MRIDVADKKEPQSDPPRDCTCVFAAARCTSNSFIFAENSLWTNNDPILYKLSPASRGKFHTSRHRRRDIPDPKNAKGIPSPKPFCRPDGEGAAVAKAGRHSRA